MTPLTPNQSSQFSNLKPAPLITNHLVLNFINRKNQILQIISGTSGERNIYLGYKNTRKFFSQMKIYLQQIFYQILHSGEWKQISCLVFFYSGQIFCWQKALFKLRHRHSLNSNFSPNIVNYFLFASRYPFWSKQLLRVLEMYLFSKSFILAGGIKNFVQWKQYSCIYNFFRALKSTSSSRNKEFH